MISHLSGVVASVEPGRIVVDVGGIGFEVLVPRGVSARAGGEGSLVRLLTHMVVRDDALILYGFSYPSEREMFRLLIGVNRIGPATALAVLSTVPVADIAGAILAGDQEILTRVPGIGKKGAQRVILELKDRLRERTDLLVPAAGITGAGPPGNDALLALVALGFPRQEALRALASAAAEGMPSSTEDLVKAALRQIREG